MRSRRRDTRRLVGEHRLRHPVTPAQIERIKVSDEVALYLVLSAHVIDLARIAEGVRR